jgi:hypothetical protein
MARKTRSQVLLAALVGSALSCTGGDGTAETGDTSAATASTGAAPSSSSTTATTATTSAPTSTSTADPTESADPSTSGTSEPATSTVPVIPDMPMQCLAATQPCTDPSECCVDDGLTCDTTTLGQVCCGLEGTGCVTPNGEDCCGDLLCVAGTCLSPGATPPFKAPYPCGQSWTYSHHDAEVRRALDFVDNGGNTDNAPVLAALDGVATRHYQDGGAGNYIVIEHGGGWKTYYFHLQSYSVEDGTFVTTGQEVGRVGSTGASSGPHIHFEELYFDEGKDIWLDGQLLAPYPGVYGEKSLTSQNCP